MHVGTNNQLIVTHWSLNFILTNLEACDNIDLEFRQLVFKDMLHVNVTNVTIKLNVSMVDDGSIIKGD